MVNVPIQATLDPEVCVAIYKTYIQIIHIDIPKEQDTDSSQVTDQDQDQLEIAIEAHFL
jgi:hypothetical protein